MCAHAQMLALLEQHRPLLDLLKEGGEVLAACHDTHFLRVPLARHVLRLLAICRLEACQ